MKLAQICLVILLTVGSFGIVKYSKEALQSYDDYKLVQQLEALSKSSTAWSDATVALSLERSVTQVALSLSEPAPRAFLDLIEAQRTLSDSLFQQALADLGNVEGFELESEFREKSSVYSDNINKIRSEVDQLLAAPMTARAKDRAKDIPYEIKSQISKLKSMSYLMVVKNKLTSSAAFALSSIQNAAWEIREYGGRARTYYAIATLNGSPIADDLHELIKSDSARAINALSIVSSILQTIEVNEDFRKSIDVSSERYLETYLPILENIDAAMTGDNITYPISFEDFFQISNEALDGMAKISTDAGSELRAYWESRRNIYLNNLMYELGFMLLDILIVCAALYFISMRITARVSYAATAIEAVANGDLDQDIDERKNDVSEIKNLMSSLRKLIHSAREARKLAATLDDVEEQEKKRLQAEKDREERLVIEAEAAREREAVAAQEKDRLIAFTSFQADMEHVLGEAASGNFSNRMTNTVADESLAALANVINRLLEATETNIGDVVKSIDALANGDLGVRIEGDRQGAFLQMQEDFNSALTTLSKSMARIMSSGQTVSATSFHLESASLSMAKRAEKSAATIEETSAAAEQIAASIQQVVANAKAADEATRKVRISADKTKEVSDETEASINAMTEASDQIDRVVKVIEDIAFQINLLALNAGVEAARAGEAGRGFSVVASEVRALAQRSQEAVQEISQVIELNTQSVNAGVKQVGLSRQALEGIIRDVEVASSQISDIATAVEQQALGIEEVNNSVRSIDSVSQTNAAALEEMTASSVALNEEAKALNVALAEFHGVENQPVEQNGSEEALINQTGEMRKTA